MCVCVVGFFFFFFQAEDGIRDLVRSRGLGDVYKRQPPCGEDVAFFGEPTTHRDAARDAAVEHGTREQGPVSYTHLTLPTIYSV